MTFLENRNIFLCFGFSKAKSFPSIEALRFSTIFASGFLLENEPNSTYF